MTTQRQFRRQQEIRALCAGASGKIKNFCRVTGKVANRGVDLGNGNFETHGICLR